LIQTACLSFLTLMTQKAIQLHTLITATASVSSGPADAEKLSTFLAFSSFRLVFMLILLFGVTSMVRRTGWKNKNEMNEAGIAEDAR